MKGVSRDPERQGEAICQASALANLQSLCFQVRYRGELREAILIRHRGRVSCFLNQCVHMPRRLDCEDPYVFDDSGRFLRCSMHGIVYEPGSGLCRSDICLDEQLTVLKVVERDGWVLLADRHSTVIR